MSDLAQWVMAGCAFLTLFGIVMGRLWKLSIDPIKTLIENNTEAMHDLRQMRVVDRTTIDNHEVRIVRIETVHEMEEISG